MTTTTHLRTRAIDQIWFTRCPVRTATGIAADLGWLHDEFASDRIAVASLQDFPTGAPAAPVPPGARAVFREAGNIPALWARARGAKTRVVGLTWLEERQVILARPESGLRGPADLRGRRLAVPRRDGIGVDFRRAMALQGFAGALAVAGLGLSDVRLVDVDDQRRLAADRAVGQWDPEFDALRRNEVDAIYMKGAVAVELARYEGAEIVVDFDAFPDRRVRVNNGTPRPITVDQRVLDDRPDLVARFLAVVLRAADWAAVDPDRPVRSLHPDLSTERLALLEQQKDFLRGHGFLDGDVDVLSWIDPAPLGAARDMVEARHYAAQFIPPAEPRDASSREAHPSTHRHRSRAWS